MHRDATESREPGGRGTALGRRGAWHTEVSSQGILCPCEALSHSCPQSYVSLSGSHAQRFGGEESMLPGRMTVGSWEPNVEKRPIPKPHFWTSFLLVPRQRHPGQPPH